MVILMPDRKCWSSFVYGLPELHREELRGATRISGTGCLATTAILGLAPLVASGLVAADPIVVEAKVGSSAGGVSPGADSHHPERSGAFRSFAPVGHRHTGELLQELPTVNGQALKIHFSATAC